MAPSLNHENEIKKRWKRTSHKKQVPALPFSPITLKIKSQYHKTLLEGRNVMKQQGHLRKAGQGLTVSGSPARCCKFTIIWFGSNHCHLLPHWPWYCHLLQMKGFLEGLRIFLTLPLLCVAVVLTSISGPWSVVGGGPQTFTGSIEHLSHLSYLPQVFLSSCLLTILKGRMNSFVDFRPLIFSQGLKQLHRRGAHVEAPLFPTAEPTLPQMCAVLFMCNSCRVLRYR